jgi:hypothetical protein
MVVQELAKKLAQIARMRRRIWFWPLGLVLLLALLAWRSPHSPYRIAAITAWWLIGFGFSLLGLSLARCPRCGSRFFAQLFLPAGKACASCGLPLKPPRVVYPTLE